MYHSYFHTVAAVPGKNAVDCCPTLQVGQHIFSRCVAYYATYEAKKIWFTSSGVKRNTVAIFSASSIVKLSPFSLKRRYNVAGLRPIFLATELIDIRRSTIFPCSLSVFTVLITPCSLNLRQCHYSTLSLLCQ